MDVETNPSSGCSWNTYNFTSNCDFLDETVNRIKYYNRRVGIYTTGYFWDKIFGNRLACPKVSSALLWYAKYDNSPSFSDFTQIGGWTTPAMKQYAGDVQICGVDSDKNYKPWFNQFLIIQSFSKSRQCTGQYIYHSILSLLQAPCFFEPLQILVPESILALTNQPLAVLVLAGVRGRGVVESIGSGVDKFGVEIFDVVIDLRLGGEYPCVFDLLDPAEVEKRVGWDEEYILNKSWPLQSHFSWFIFNK